MKPQKPPVNPGVEIRGSGVFANGVEERDEYFLATGAYARRVSSDLDELPASRLKRTGGAVFRRRGSRFWQIKYADGKGGWRYESTHSESRREAEAPLRFRAYEASAGMLPATASVEQGEPR